MNKFGSLEVKSSRWPWHPGYNWTGMTNNSAPLNAGGARFGGGWKYKLGFATAGWTQDGIGIMFDLLFGIVTVRYRTPHGIASELKYQEERARLSREWAERRARDDKEREDARAAAVSLDKLRADRELARRAALTPQQREDEDSIPF